LAVRLGVLLDVEDAAGQDRRSPCRPIANAQRERDGYKRQVDCASPEGCGECLACVGRYLDDAVKAEAEARRVVQELRGEAREVAAEVAHLKAKRATSDEERDQARAKLGRVVALCQAELEHEPSLLSTATRSLAWVLLREVAPELADRVGTPAPAPAAKPVDGYPPSGAPDPEPVAEDVGGPEVAPAAPVETPQATETQPDPGEGWRLLGPEEVIETGDQWWGGAMVGPVWLAASATIGETPAAINAHPKATERRVFRRLIAAPIAAPIASAPVAEPVTEVAIEARGSKFVIVRRAVAP
jgi:hypothetical protein